MIQKAWTNYKKIKSFFDKLVKNFNRFIPMSENLCVDEQIILFKEKRRLKQYMQKNLKNGATKFFIV